MNDKIEYDYFKEQYRTKNDLISKLSSIKAICSKLQHATVWNEFDSMAYIFLLDESIIPRQWPNNKINTDILNGFKYIHKEDIIIDLLNRITPDIFSTYEKQFRNLLTNKPKALWPKIGNVASLMLEKSYLGSDKHHIKKWKDFCDELVREYIPSVESENNSNSGLKIILGLGVAIFAGYLGKKMFNNHHPGGSQ
jgi:hypothetical protein